MACEAPCYVPRASPYFRLAPQALPQLSRAVLKWHDKRGVLESHAPCIDAIRFHSGKTRR